MDPKGPICAILYSIILLANHFSRDAPGTIEEQLALDPVLNVSHARYATLTAVYFTPSAVVPLFLGLLSNGPNAPFTPEGVFLVCSWLAVLGNVVSAVAVNAFFGSYHGLVAGRAIAGIAYEAIDMIPLGFIPAMLPGSWSSWSGFVNGLLRLGSAFAFFFLPLVYNYGAARSGSSNGGTSAAFNVVALVGFTMGPLSTVVYKMAKQSRAERMRISSSDDSEKQQTQQGEEEEDGEEEENTNKSSLKSMFLALQSMPRIFWIYSFVGMTMYASVVPFWFYGSAFLQRSSGFSLSTADALMVLPEGAIFVLSTPVGVLIDRYKLGFAAQQRALGIASICIALSYLFLTTGAQPSMLGVVALGCSYAVSNQLFWSAFPHACPEELHSLGAGILACLNNVGATLVPALIGVIRVFVLTRTADIIMLLLLGSLALIAALICRLSVLEIKREARLSGGYEEVGEVVLTSSLTSKEDISA